jgi:hypothetical protein
MTAKTELATLLEQLPEDHIPKVVEFIHSLAKDQPDHEIPADNLQQLLKIFTTSLTNSLYDLSIDMDRKGEKVLANRLDFSRKKITEAWNTYNKKLT